MPNILLNIFVLQKGILAAESFATTELQQIPSVFVLVQTGNCLLPPNHHTLQFFMAVPMCALKFLTKIRLRW